MKILFYILPFLAGVAMAIQSGINSQLRATIQHPLSAAFISFIVGTFALAIILVFSPKSLPALSVYPQISWYKWIGGLLGAFVVTVTLLSVQEIGAANMFVLIVTGQLIMAVFLDHFGLLGMEVKSISFQKILGILLLIGGAYLVNRKEF